MRRGCPQQASREPGLRWQSRGVTVGAAVQAFPLALAGVRVERPSFWLSRVPADTCCLSLQTRAVCPRARERGCGHGRLTGLL